jgi:hypothetical protein
MRRGRKKKRISKEEFKTYNRPQWRTETPFKNMNRTAEPREQSRQQWANKRVETDSANAGGVRKQSKETHEIQE